MHASVLQADGCAALRLPSIRPMCAAAYIRPAAEADSEPASAQQPKVTVRLHAPCGGTGACECTAAQMSTVCHRNAWTATSVAAWRPSRSPPMGHSRLARPPRVGPRGRPRVSPRGPAVRQARFGAAAQRREVAVRPGHAASSLVGRVPRPGILVACPYQARDARAGWAIGTPSSEDAPSHGPGRLGLPPSYTGAARRPCQWAQSAASPGYRARGRSEVARGRLGHSLTVATRQQSPPRPSPSAWRKRRGTC